MISFSDWNKKKDKNIDDYEIVKSRSGLPMFILPNPLTQDDDEDNEVEVMTDLEIEIEIDEPVKSKTLPQKVCDVITRMF